MFERESNIHHYNYFRFITLMPYEHEGEQTQQHPRSGWRKVNNRVCSTLGCQPHKNWLKENNLAPSMSIGHSDMRWRSKLSNTERLDRVDSNYRVATLFQLSWRVATTELPASRLRSNRLYSIQARAGWRHNVHHPESLGCVRSTACTESELLTEYPE